MKPKTKAGSRRLLGAMQGHLDFARKASGKHKEEGDEHKFIFEMSFHFVENSNPGRTSGRRLHGQQLRKGVSVHLFREVKELHIGLD